jgi:hypothetical protein
VFVVFDLSAWIDVCTLEAVDNTKTTTRKSGHNTISRRESSMVSPSDSQGVEAYRAPQYKVTSKF